MIHKENKTKTETSEPKFMHIKCKYIKFMTKLCPSMGLGHLTLMAPLTLAGSRCQRETYEIVKKAHESVGHLKQLAQRRGHCCPG